MFEELKENFINMITSRVFVLILVLAAIGGVMVNRIFDLQIVHGEEYLDNFRMKIMKERTIKGSRGCIYDRNGNLLAYNELAHSVTIEDVYESGRFKNLNLNTTIYKLIQMIEGNGDNIVSDFKIILDKNNRYSFTVEGTQLYRFLADVYGHLTIDELEERERTATAAEVVDYLCGWNRFRIGEYTEEDDKTTFIPGNGYTKGEVLKILTIRYDMNNNSFQKYIATTVATDVSEATVAVVMENSQELEGVSIVEDTVRKYVDSVYFSHILGYTGKISSEELTTLNEELAAQGMGTDTYNINDVVGKNGIEASFETTLQGVKGYEKVIVDVTGKVISIEERQEAQAGKDIYLTVDMELTKAVYHILEQRLAGLVSSKIFDGREYVPGPNASSSDIKIPIYDVYFAMFNNSIIDLKHLAGEDAGEVEQAVYEAYLSYKASVYEKLTRELTEDLTPYNKLSKEYQNYETDIVRLLNRNGVIMSEAVDADDSVQVAWVSEETISLCEYLRYCISKNWIDVSKLSLNDKYSDSSEIYGKLLEYILESIDNNTEFQKKFYKYMLLSNTITGRQVCQVLCEQRAVEIPPEDEEALYSGRLSAYNFMKNRIDNIDITQIGRASCRERV